jgi:hypothetical protein
MSERKIVSDGESVDQGDVARNVGSLVREDTNRTLTQADSGKTFVSINGGNSPVSFTLPASAEVGTLYAFIGDTENVEIAVPSGVTLRMPWGAVTDDEIRGEDDRGDLEASIQIVAETATSWVVRYGTGGWYSVDDSTKRIWYDGWVQGAGEDQVAGFDAYGALKTGGASRKLYDLDKVYGRLTVTGGAAYTINTANAWHGYDLVTILGSLWMTEKDGTSGSDITAYATHDSGASTKVTTTAAHGLAVDDIITITGSLGNYDEIYEVIEIVDTTNFVIDKAWDTNDDGQGTYTRPDALKVNTNYNGRYLVLWSFSGSIATSAAECEFGVFVNKTLKKKIGKDFTTASQVEAVAGNVIVDASVDDQIWFGLLNKDNTNNIDIDEMELDVTRV